MKKHQTSFLQGLIVAGIAAFWFERRHRTFTGATARSYRRDVESLLDLNHASKEELAELPGLNADLVSRIIENRPYHNKLDLISRVVVAEETYEVIKSLIHVPPEATNELVQVATG